MKTFLKIAFLVLIDFVIIWAWIKLLKPDPSIGILIIILVPFVFILNLIIAAILFFFKNQNSKFFLLNSIIASLVMFCLFPQEISNRLNDQYDIWEFTLGDTTFQITIEENSLDHLFSATYKVKQQGMTNTLVDGIYENRDDTLFLIGESLEMYILENKLYNFQNRDKVIPLIEIEY